jgi:hypothetical protein
MSASVGKHPYSALGHFWPIRGSTLTREDGSREDRSKNNSVLTIDIGCKNLEGFGRYFISGLLSHWKDYVTESDWR